MIKTKNLTVFAAFMLALGILPSLSHAHGLAAERLCKELIWNKTREFRRHYPERNVEVVKANYYYGGDVMYRCPDDAARQYDRRAKKMMCLVGYSGITRLYDEMVEATPLDQLYEDYFVLPVCDRAVVLHPDKGVDTKTGS